MAQPPFASQMNESRLPQNEFEGACGILKEYHRTLVQQLADEIVQKGDYFTLLPLGDADDLIERYSWRFSRLSTVYTNLARFVSSEKPQGNEPLGRDDFRCFSCGGVIRRDDTDCNLCGWTWK